jgi:LuxR family maltose regulon positive regulatory protein
LMEADRLCADALPLLANVASLHCYTAGRCLLARVRSALGHREEGWRMLDDLHGYLDACEARHLLVQLASEKVIHSARHSPEVMERIADEFALDSVEVSWVENAHGLRDDASDLALLGYAQALRLVRLAELDRALPLIKALIGDAQQHTDEHRLILLEALQTIVHERLGNHAAMRNLLARALARARGAGFTRSVFDEIPEFASLFATEIRSGRIDSVLPRKYVERYAELFGLNGESRGGSACTSKGYSVEALTHREANILMLLAQGLSNQEICVHTRIAMTTTKWHLKNIFAKLNVRTRTAALARARALELIK